MFGIPVIVWQIVIAILKATGAINAASALSLKLIVKVDTTLKNLKTYHANSDFPSKPNDPFGTGESDENID